MLLLRELFGDGLSLHYHDDRTGEPPVRGTPGPGSCVHGHFDNRRSQGVEDYYPAVEQLITILRDPFDMQVSCYFYTKRLAAQGALFLDGQPAQVESTLVEYLERRIDDPELGPNVLDHLPVALAGDDWESAIERSFVYVGITEDLRTSAVVLADRLGHAPRWLGHANASSRNEEVPRQLREPYMRAHPREAALYDYAARNYDDPKAFRGPIGKSRLERDELEYRCQLCVDYVACASTGRPRACDGGSAFRPLSRPVDGTVAPWLEAVARLDGGAEAVTMARTLAGRADLWIGPALVWRDRRPSAFELTLGWPGRAVGDRDLGLLGELLGEHGTGLLSIAERCVRAGATSSLFAIGAASPRILVPLDPRTSSAGLLEELGLLASARELHQLPYLVEIEANGDVRVHVRSRQLPANPLLDALGVLEGTSVVYGLTSSDARPLAAEVSLVRSRLDWHDLGPALRGAGLDIGPYNRLKAGFHLVEGALTVPIERSDHPTVLHYRALRCVNPTL